MLGLPPSVSITKEDSISAPPPGDGVHTPPVITPPIITHTAATPMPTPQGSPNGAFMSIKSDAKNNLAVSHALSAYSAEYIDRSSVCIFYTTNYNSVYVGLLFVCLSICSVLSVRPSVRPSSQSECLVVPSNLCRLLTNPKLLNIVM